MRPHFFSTLSSAALLLLTACSHENSEPEGFPERSREEIPQVLVDKILQEVWTSRTEFVSGGVRLHFSDGETLLVPQEVIPLQASRPEMTLSPEGKWLRNGNPTGHFFQNTENLREASPVGGYREDGHYALFMTNGATLHFLENADQFLQHVSFLQEDNGTPFDIRLRQSGRTFSGNVMLAQEKPLMPRFDCYGAEVSEDGKPWVSGSTVTAFNRPHTLQVRTWAGKSYTFQIDVTPGRPDTPSVFITTDSGNPVSTRSSYVHATIRFEDPHKRFSEETFVEAGTRIRGRGNTSWTLSPKKPYRVKLDEKKELFGMPKEKDWDLLANYADKTLLRNPVAYYISELVGMSWTPMYRECDVYMNGRYDGSYLLIQHKEVDKRKVNISPVGPEVISGSALEGDYYLEIESKMDNPVCFYTSIYRMPIMFNDPEEPNSAQQNYIVSYFTELETVLSSSRFDDPVAGWRKYLDEDSMINNYIIQELTKNMDGNLRKSTYMTKEKGKKLVLYHVWDFDIALGNNHYLPVEFPPATNGPTGWFIKEFGRLGAGTGWYPRLFQDPAFVANLKLRWNTLKPLLDGVPDFIEAEVRENGEDYAHNFQRWPILDEKIWPNLVCKHNYAGEVEYLTSFYLTRLEWLDKEINAL